MIVRSVGYWLKGGKICIGLLVAMTMIIFVSVHMQVPQTPAEWSSFDNPETNDVTKGFPNYRHSSIENTPSKSIQTSSAQSMMRLLYDAASSIWDGQSLDHLASLNGTAMANTLDPATKHNSLISRAFHPGMSPKDRRDMMNLLRTFANLAEANNVTYFLYSGSLLGSCRHHGMIPWDDDVDLVVNEVQKPKLKEALIRDLPLELSFTPTGTRWKLWSSLSNKTSSRVAWNFPFLDISFYIRRGSRVLDADPEFQNRFHFKESSVFPLVKRPFWNAWFPAPRKSREMIETTYNIDECMSKTYSHKEEKWISDVIVIPCEMLSQYFPFVKRRNTEGGSVNEILEVNGSIKQRIQDGVF